jgi:hypothetical protein
MLAELGIKVKSQRVGSTVLPLSQSMYFILGTSIYNNKEEECCDFFHIRFNGTPTNLVLIRCMLTLFL